MFEGWRRSSCVLLLAAAPLLFAGCDQGGGEDSTGGTAREEQSGEDHPHGEGKHREGGPHASEGDSEAVTVPEGGKKFEPSVSADRVPKGAWHCNMKGKVHYAAMKKGDGECPVCGMDLVQK